MKKILLTLVLAIVFNTDGRTSGSTNEIVQLSETYELANIILAITPYGKSDRWEVSQNSDYYREVRKHFDAFESHPLLQKVNYSREQWASYLSFRTDAYAFAFGKDDQLVRQFPFFANEGFKPFDENLELIEDFVKQTGFRTFYNKHKGYYAQLASDYLKSQYYDDMVRFLTREFGGKAGAENYAIALSPLVGRMNCHRTVRGIGTDFITVPQFLLSGAPHDATDVEIASGTHMLFTELDHGFVNPATNVNQQLVTANFSVALWNKKSGYESDSLAVFNEYMTWAVFDIFVHERFPSVAHQVTADWALQNETRGFIASSLFNHELLRLYRQRKDGQTLRDLYPELLRCLKTLEQDIHVPEVVSCNIHNKTIADSTAKVVIQFSEAMEELPIIDVVLYTEVNGVSKVKVVDIQPGTKQWLLNGTELHFSVNLNKGQTTWVRLNCPWQTRQVFRSKTGVDLTPYTTFKVTVKR